MADVPELSYSLLAPGWHRFSVHRVQVDLSFDQYLIEGAAQGGGGEALLVHTGDVGVAAVLADKLPSFLGGRPLSHIFVSHFESDECGGLGVLLERYPECRVMTSGVTARQLTGFKITNNATGLKPGETFDVGTARFQALSYPSEMHLWDGLALWWPQRGVIFSGDLFVRRGEAESAPVESTWRAELDGIRPEQIPDPVRLERLRKALAVLPARCLAPGHGPLIQLR